MTVERGHSTRPQPRSAADQEDSGTSVTWRLWAELRWSFTPPWVWLAGVAANLALSLLWLVAVPLTGRPHSDWAIVIGTYFAVFILADVTSTNILGADAARVHRSLENAVPLRRILFIKNLTLLVIVGGPTLLATIAVTLSREGNYRLIDTVPGVAFPILTWLGVGNLVSTVLPVATAPLRDRWAQRRDLRKTLRWAFHLALPYALLVAVDPVGDLPRWIRRHGDLPNTTLSRGLIHLLTGVALWGLGSLAALAVARRHAVRIR